MNLTKTRSKLAALLGTTSLLTVSGTLAAHAGEAMAQMAQVPEEIPENVLITGSLIRGTAAIGVPVTNLTPMDFGVTGAVTTAQLFMNYPAANVASDQIFVQDGALWTSAGVTAGIDLALKLIEDDHGRDVALSVARRLVVFLKRPGGQSQFSAHLAAQVATEGRIQAVQHWILDHLPLELTVITLASRAGMSVRNFTRVFQQEAGMTPADFVEMARVDSARRLLEDTDKPLQRVASSCGFANPDTMRRAFLRRIGTGPSEYRERFRG